MPDEQHGELVHAEHLVRYRLAAQLAASRRVLDAACGEGYGTALLARGGRPLGHRRGHRRAERRARPRAPPGPEFVAADVARAPVRATARSTWSSASRRSSTWPMPERVLAELARVMAEDGVCSCSTPNKHQYLVENEFHEREFFHEEFVALLEARFERVEILLQHNWLTSAVLAAELARAAVGRRATRASSWPRSRPSSRAPSSTRSACAEPASCRRLQPGGCDRRGRRSPSAGPSDWSRPSAQPSSWHGTNTESA